MLPASIDEPRRRVAYEVPSEPAAPSPPARCESRTRWVTKRVDVRSDAVGVRILFWLVGENGEKHWQKGWRSWQI